MTRACATYWATYWATFWTTFWTPIRVPAVWCHTPAPKSAWRRPCLPGQIDGQARRHAHIEGRIVPAFDLAFALAFDS